MSARDQIDRIVDDVRRTHYGDDVRPALTPGQGVDSRPELDLDRIAREAREGGCHSRREKTPF